MIETLAQRWPFVGYAVLVAVGMYIMLTHRSLLKVIIGLSILQSGVILFFMLVAFRAGSSVPITTGGRPAAVHDPLPHTLMLTAIVVGVATVGVALALLRRVQDEKLTIEDGEDPP